MLELWVLAGGLAAGGQPGVVEATGRSGVGGRLADGQHLARSARGTPRPGSIAALGTPSFCSGHGTGAQDVDHVAGLNEARDAVARVDRDRDRLVALRNVRREAADLGRLHERLAHDELTLRDRRRPRPCRSGRRRSRRRSAGGSPSAPLGPDQAAVERLRRSRALRDVALRDEHVDALNVLLRHEYPPCGRTRKTSRPRRQPVRLRRSRQAHASSSRGSPYLGPVINCRIHWH